MKPGVASPGTNPAARDASALARRYAEVRAVTRELAAPLSPEDAAIQSMPEASPAKWHLAHTTWFFETFILEARDAARKPFDAAYRVLFNSYYNAVGDKHPRPERGMLSRPALADVLRYREAIDAELGELLNGEALADGELALLELGLNHEQQHQELLLTDVKHLFSRNPLRPVYRKSWPLTTVHPNPVEWLDIPGGKHETGFAGGAFHFDNEAPRHAVWLEDFQIASRPVTHGDYLRFIEDGGYRRPELWLSAGWDAVSQRGWQAPLYWEKVDGQWLTFTLHGMAPIEANTPVCHVSFYEAEAYARWAGTRLPTEAEWEVVAGNAAIEGNFLESRALHPLAAREPAPAGVPAQLFGDVWEWTRSDYAPYPGFRVADGAVGEYNGKFMCNQYVLRGGSCATPASHIRATYRNFFPADARWQFSGMRLARDAQLA
jgi:ergothioneine biosynthesis protein EgtB